MSLIEWWEQLDDHGKAWKAELASPLGGQPTEAALKKLLATKRLTLYVHKGGTLDLTPLARFTKLTELDISGFKQLTNTAVLRTLTSLRQLTLKNDGLADVAFLADLTGLTSLAVPQNKLTSIAPVAKLTKLTALDVSHNKLADLGPLVALKQLATLSIAVNKVANLAPLAGLVALRELVASDNPFADLAPLAALTRLVTLDIDGPFTVGKVKSVAALAGLTKLQTLTISNHKITDLSPLAGCTALQTLRAETLPRDTSFAALLPLTHLTRIDTHREIMPKADQAAFKKRKVDVNLD